MTIERPRRTRTVHDYPGVIRVERHGCGGEFSAPDEQEIDANEERIHELLSAPSVGLLLPLGSERERETFSSVIHYVSRCGVQPAQVSIVYSEAAAKIVEDLELERRGYDLIHEGRALALCDPARIHERFAVDLLSRGGKGRAILLGFLHLLYVARRRELRTLFLFDVDVIIGQYRPLEYLAYPHVARPRADRSFVLTAQNNAKRDNHYLVIPRELWRHESELGRHYADHFDKLVWSLTGEMSLDWELAEQVPFSLGYGIETVWQLFAADLAAQTDPRRAWHVTQVVNPWTKEDGGTMGQSGRCFDAMMYVQLNRIAWFLIKHGRRLAELGPDDYRDLNAKLSQAGETSLLPDNGDHGPPYRVHFQSDLFIPPIRLLRSEACLRC